MWWHYFGGSSEIEQGRVQDARIAVNCIKFDGGGDAAAAGGGGGSGESWALLPLLLLPLCGVVTLLTPLLLSASGSCCHR
jgi:hypothetical protein